MGIGKQIEVYQVNMDNTEVVGAAGVPEEVKISLIMELGTSVEVVVEVEVVDVLLEVDKEVKEREDLLEYG